MSSNIFTGLFQELPRNEAAPKIVQANKTPNLRLLSFSDQGSTRSGSAFAGEGNQLPVLRPIRRVVMPVIDLVDLELSHEKPRTGELIRFPTQKPPGRVVDIDEAPATSSRPHLLEEIGRIIFAAPREFEMLGKIEVNSWVLKVRNANQSITQLLSECVGKMLERSIHEEGTLFWDRNSRLQVAWRNLSDALGFPELTEARRVIAQLVRDSLEPRKGSLLLRNRETTLGITRIRGFYR